MQCDVQPMKIEILCVNEAIYMAAHNLKPIEDKQTKEHKYMYIVFQCFLFQTCSDGNIYNSNVYLFMFFSKTIQSQKLAILKSLDKES